MTSFDNGKRFGSCAIRAARYWSTRFSKHVRLQLSGIGPVDASAMGARPLIKPTADETTMIPTKKRFDRMACSPLRLRGFYRAGAGITRKGAAVEGKV